MAYNEELAFRIKKNLILQNIDFVEKKMFGGLAFMINDKMCIGIIKEELMLRVLETNYEDLLKKDYVRPMNFTGKIMRGMVFVESEGLTSEKKLQEWINYGLEFAEKGVVKSKKKK